MGEVSNWKTSFLVWHSAKWKARSSVDQRRAEKELETVKLVSYQLGTLERKAALVCFMLRRLVMLR